MLFRARQIVFFRQKPMSVLFHKSRGFTKTWTQIWFAGPRGFDYFMLRYVYKVHKPMDTPTNDLCFVTKGLGDVVKQNIYDVNMCVSCTWNVCFSFVLTKHNLWNSCVCHFLALPKITICWICVSMYSGTIVKQTPPATIFLRWIGPEIWTYHDSSPLKFHDTLANLIDRRSQIPMHVHFEQRHEQSHKHGSTQICEHILYGSCTYKIRAQQLIIWCRSAQQHVR